MKTILVSALLVIAVSFSTTSGHAAFPGRNGGILYVCHSYELCTIKPDGSGETTLTKGFSPNAFNGSWSPHGHRIAFGCEAAHADIQICVMRSDGAHIRQVTRSPNPSSSFLPAWSPNGHRIVFAFSGAEKGLRILNLRTGKIIVLTHRGNTPAWSPTGRIAYSASVHGDLAIFAINPDGTGRKRLTHKDGHDDYWPDWSPHGRYIVFQRDNGSRHNRIMKIRADGTHLETLIAGGEDRAPAWSPDGSRIVFYAGQPFEWRLFAMKPDGSDVRRVATSEIHGRYPDWQPLP